MSGTQLIVQKRNSDGSLQAAAPYTIRGVDWSPASKTTNTTPTDPNNVNVRRPEFQNWYQTDAPLIAAVNANTIRTYMDMGADSSTFDSTVKPILDLLYNSGIMVILTVDDAINSTSRIQQAVPLYKDHPALLMWLVGDEWNNNLYFGVAPSVQDAAQRTQNAAQLIKSLDTNHPVATSYGDIDIDANGLRLSDTSNYVNSVCPSVDVWGLQIYRGNTFGTLFSQWQSISPKPMFLAEFGADAFASSTVLVTCPQGAVNEQAQVDWDLSLWNDLSKNLSAQDTSKVCLGGLVFEFEDEWWKVSPPDSQQTCGFASSGQPDGFANEEFFGIVDIDRNPRQVYSALQNAFA
ncbi:MAG: glycoside hydrolase family 2 TIM barrel-domain containing protein [Terriglobia bacterium]